MEAIVVQRLIYIPIMFHLWLFLNLRNFSNIFCTRLSEKFLLEISGILSTKLDTNDHFIMAKDSICYVLALTLVWIKLNRHFLPNSNRFKTLLQKNEVLSNFPSIFCLKFWKRLILFEKPNMLTLQGPRTS